MTVEELGHRMSAKEMVEWTIEGRLREEDRKQAELNAEAEAKMARLKASR
jgi:hypothetical protein